MGRLTSSALAMLAALLLACGAFPRHAAAQEEKPQHPLTNMPGPGAVQTAFLLPSFPDKKFPAGRIVDVVLGLHNEGSEAYNVSLIAGSLNSPADFSLHVQNFSMVAYGEVVGPGEEASLTYKFVPDSRLSPNDFVVALTAFYTDPAGQWYSSTFFNQTVDIVEEKKLIDWELLSLAGGFAGALVGAAYLVYSWVVSKGWIKPKKKVQRKQPVPSDAQPANPDEWISGSAWAEWQRKKQAADRAHQSRKQN